MVEEKTGQANDGILSPVKEPSGTWFGCVFLNLRGEALHLSKPMIQLAWKSEGIGCKIIKENIDEAQSGDRSEVELTDKLSNFAAIEFAKSIRLPVTFAAAWLW
ncbi:MAG: hypothetical protein ACJ0UT_05505 [Candidatus Latescibacterota bacterium]